MEEFFIEFVKVIEITRDELFIELKDSLKILKLDLSVMTEQGYNSGVYIKGQYTGASSRVLREYPRVFYFWCDCHYINLAFCDMTMRSSS